MRSTSASCCRISGSRIRSWAITTRRSRRFDEAHRLSPKDPSTASYLIEAQIAAKKYAAAADTASAALKENPGELRLVRLQAQALRHTGKAAQGATALEAALKTHDDDPSAYIALAQFYADVDRGSQAVKLLQDAQLKFPQDSSVAFELGAVLDKQKKYAEAESAFRALLSREPDNAAALNYLGYMLAERGDRLDESVRLVSSALKLDRRTARISTASAGRTTSRTSSILANPIFTKRRSAPHELRDPGALRRGAAEARTPRRSDRRVHTRARRRRRFDRSRRHRQEDPGCPRKLPKK